MNDIAATLARGHALNHKNALEAVGALDDPQLRWRPARSNSIGFNLWHMARWADHLASILSTMTPELRERLGASQELWAREGVAKRWRFPTQGLGNVDTGMGMDEDRSAALLLPPKDELLAYVTRAFEGAERALAAVRDEDLGRPAELEASRVPWLAPSGYGNVGSWIAPALRHEARHLGMIEAIKGAAGMRGTVTV